MRSFSETVGGSTGSDNFIAPLNSGVVRRSTANLACNGCFHRCGAISNRVVALGRLSFLSHNAFTSGTGTGNSVRPHANCPVASRRTFVLSASSCSNRGGVHGMHGGNRICVGNMVGNLAPVPTS